jgi:hypothetical protein
MMPHLTPPPAKQSVDANLITCVIGFIPDSELGFMDASVQLLLGVESTPSTQSP